MPKKKAASVSPSAPAVMPPAPSASSSPHANVIEKELHDIYAELGDEGRDMTTLDQSKSSRAKHVLVGLTVFFAALAAVAWTGFFVFSPSREKFNGEKVMVEIQGPTEPKSGELVNYRIKYKNGEPIPLGTAILAIRMPKEFVLNASEPAAENLEWKIGSLAPDKEGAISLSGTFTAPLKTQLDLQAIMTYRPADFNSEFQKVTTQSVMINDSVFTLALTAPTKTLPGEKVTMTVDYGNAGTSESKNAVIRLTYPQGFIADGSTPKADDDAFVTWSLAPLPAEAKGKISISGTFASQAKGDLDIKTELFLKNANGDLTLQKSASAVSNVIGGELITALIINGKTDDQAIEFGDTLRMALTYRNTGDVLLEDVSLSLVFDTEPSARVLLWNSLKDPEGGIRDGNRLTWSKKQISALGSMKPGDEGSIDIELPILVSPLPGTEQSLYKVSAWIEAKVEKADGTAITRITKSQPVVAKVQSDTVLTAEGRYFSTNQEPIGSGPLPPKVGEATTYRVTWKITNSLHELSDLKVSATLPANVVWSGRSSVDAGTLRFDAGAERMIWTLNRMPISVKVLNVSFDVTLTPDDEQRGKIASLLDATTMEAIDKVTGFPMIMSSPPISTQLDNDPLAAGKGRVE